MDARGAQTTPLFAVEGDVRRWEDVVALARARGDWEAVEADVRAGLAALRELEARGESPAQEEVEAAGRDFRYARGLLAGDELDAWLDRRGLVRADWGAYLERLAARRRLPSARQATIPGEEVEDYLWAEATCSGRLDALALALARGLAVAPGAPVDAVDAALDAFKRKAASEDLVVREIETNRLELLRFRYRSAGFENEDAAREAALCVGDGEPLEAVAERAGVSVEERTEWLVELAPGLSTSFLAARPGDLVGPLADDDGYRLALLLEKLEPAVDDEVVRSRAAAAVAERAVEREASGRVVWLEPL